MFKNRALQVSMVKTEPTIENILEETVVRPYQDPVLMTTLAKDLIWHTSITIGSAVGGYKILTTVCEIAKIAAKAKL